jgi:hypothetical protein
VITAAPPRALLEPGADHTAPGYRATLRALETAHVPLKVAEAGRRIDVGGGAVFEVLAPPRPLLEHTRSDVNSNSIVLRLDYRSASFLLTGDSEAPTEEHLLASGRNLRARVLKVAHHGSRHASTAAFLEAVRPAEAVISCGAGNYYGHPSPETLARLGAVGARVWRTDTNGDVVATTDGERIDLRAARGSPVAPGAAALAPAGSPASGASASAGASAAAVAGAAGNGFVASRRARTYHTLDCKVAAAIRETNRTRFGSREEAERAGRRPHSCARAR